MCTLVALPNGEELATVEELQARGWSVDGLHDQTIPGECLCCADVPAILDRAGVKYEWDPFGYKVTG